MILIVPGIITGILTGVGGGLISTAIQARNRPRFPKLAPAAGFAEALALQRRGLQPRIDFDPVTGDLVISTKDQPPALVQRLALEAFQRRTISDVTAELLREDPLLFIRALPPGDPRRVAAGLDPLSAPGGVSVPPAAVRSAPLSVTGAVPRETVRPRFFPGFRRRSSFGQFARIQI